MRVLDRSAARALTALTVFLVAVAASACSQTTLAPPGTKGVARPNPIGGAVALSPDPSLRPTPETSTAGGLAPPRVAAASVIVENLDTGAVLFAKNEDVRRPIASLTKIMTAGVVLQATRPTDMIIASKLAARQRPTTLGLRPGQSMNVHDALYALLLHSSNDVAVALAQHVSGSVAAFDDLMTMRAITIGLGNTRFASPNGLNDHGYSTARDVATMTRWAYGSPAFASIVATKTYALRLPSGKRARLRNLNRLLFEYPGAIGVKTGFTYVSHWSLVGVARRGTTRLMVVLLGDPNPPFRDGEALLTWAFGVAGVS
jgi:D-alanyl-D-alanine carboxypeptidase (penicillin-binding protein 5/6)